MYKIKFVIEGYGIPPSLSHLTICVRSGSPATRTSLSDSERHRIIKINDKTEESDKIYSKVAMLDNNRLTFVNVLQIHLQTYSDR